MIDEQARQAERTLERTPEVFHRLLRTGMSEVEAERKMFGYAGIDVAFGVTENGNKLHRPVPSRYPIGLIDKQFTTACNRHLDRHLVNRHLGNLHVVPHEDAIRLKWREDYHGRTLCTRCFGPEVWLSLLNRRELDMRARALSILSIQVLNATYPNQMKAVGLPVPRCALGLHPVGTVHCLACRWAAGR